jgi:exodeoxyribonuclease-3
VSLRLLSYNIRYGGAGREAQIARVIGGARPDVVILEEATRPDILKKVAGLCGLPHYGSRLGESVAWMSRTQPASAVWHKPFVAKRAWLALDVAGVRILGVHLAAIHSNLTEQRRVWEARAILATVPRDRFHVLTGDFNSIAPGDPFDLHGLPARLRAFAWATGGPIRWRTIAMFLAAGYADAHRVLHPAPGYTFPTWRPSIRLDYCFVPEMEQSRVLSCDVIQSDPAPEASDHFPLLTVLE